jgi:O-antigen ligase
MSTRNWLIKKGMEYFWKRPITGYGLDNFRIITNYSNLYSHNNFIEILFSSGVIGFCIYYSKYLLLLIKQCTLKLTKSNHYYITAKMLLCLFVIFTVFEYWFVTYYERSIIIVHIFILGFINIKKTSDACESD